MKKYWKFAVIIGVVLATLTWLAVAGVNETKTYYLTVAELQAMQGKALDKRLRVAGDVEPDSIKRTGTRVSFILTQEGRRQEVIYTGKDPLPDTFKDNAQALAEGRLGPDNVFEAKRIQAKCASKYEAKPGEVAPRTAPPNKT